jgi:hypothetical protein
MAQNEPQASPKNATAPTAAAQVSAPLTKQQIIEKAIEKHNLTKAPAAP